MSRVRTSVFALALVAVAACDSPTEPTTPVTTPVTTGGTFETTVGRGEGVSWSQAVELEDGTTWDAAEVLDCREVRPLTQSWACATYTVSVSGNVATFSGTKANEYATVMRIQWEATGTERGSAGWAGGGSRGRGDEPSDRRR